MKKNTLKSTIIYIKTALVNKRHKHTTHTYTHTQHENCEKKKHTQYHETISEWRKGTFSRWHITLKMTEQKQLMKRKTMRMKNDK